TEREFDEDDRAGLQLFARFQSLNDAVAAMKSIGGDASDVDDWVASGLLAKFPRTFSPAEFLDFFEGLALVWLTGPKVHSVDGDDVLLAVPDSDGVVKVSALLHALLYDSTSNVQSGVDLPTRIHEAIPDKQDALEFA